MSISVGVSGTNKTATPSVGVGGAWKAVAAGWVGVGGAWKEFYRAINAAISNASAYTFVSSPSEATAQYLLNSDGRAQKVENSSTSDISGEWLVAGANSDFEVYATVDSGTLTSGPTGSWVSLSTSRVWTLTRGTVGLSSVDLTIEIRRASDAVVVDSATITLTAEVDSGA